MAGYGDQQDPLRQHDGGSTPSNGWAAGGQPLGSPSRGHWPVMSGNTAQQQQHQQHQQQAQAQQPGQQQAWQQQQQQQPQQQHSLQQQAALMQHMRQQQAAQQLPPGSTPYVQQGWQPSLPGRLPGGMSQGLPGGLGVGGLTTAGAGGMPTGSMPGGLNPYLHNFAGTGGASSGLSGLDPAALRSIGLSTGYGAMSGGGGLQASQAATLQSQLRGGGGGGGGAADAWAQRQALGQGGYPGGVLPGVQQTVPQLPNVGGRANMMSPALQQAYLQQAQRAAQQQAQQQQQYGGQQRSTYQVPQQQQKPVAAPAARTRTARKPRAVDGWATEDDTDSEGEADAELAARLATEYNPDGPGGSSRPRRRAASAASQKFQEVYKQLGGGGDDDDEESSGDDDDRPKSKRRKAPQSSYQMPPPLQYQQQAAAPFGQQQQQQPQQQPQPYGQQPSPYGQQPQQLQAAHRAAYPQQQALSPAPYQQQQQQQQQSVQGGTFREVSPDYQREGAGARASARGGRKVSYKEDRDSELDSDEEEAERRKAQLAKNTQPPAFVDVENMDDEVERILGHRDIEGMSPIPGDKWPTREFHIKWRRWSFIHTSWDNLATLSQLAGYKRVTNYMKRADEHERQRARLSREELELLDVEKQMEEQLTEQHMQVERIFAHKQDAAGTQKLLVKWQGLPYAEATFEMLDDVIKIGGQKDIVEYQERERRLMGPTRNVEAQRRQFRATGTRALEAQPAYLKGGTLRDYQLDGLNWLVYSWSCANNCILADEMGLGKTIQCVSLLGYLSELQGVGGPFLVVVPLSTVPNWIREFRRWLPQLNALVYVGDTKSREVLRHFEFTPGYGSLRQYKFEAIITTYELVLKDAPILSRVRWAYLMVDEAHRLKNNESALYQELVQWSFQSKLLITGTPLQNSIKELWSLLHFLEPDRFPSCEDFEINHSLDNAEHVARLHQELRPHLLRRVIKDVEKSLPPKNERILRVDMTPLQKQFYKWILGRNFRELNKGNGNMKLLNIIMELKKCCNHPFLFPQAEEEYRGREGDVGAADRLVLTSGKMVLLDKLLRRLKDTNHRVLIFSQMVRVLDIVSDYMRLRGLQHQRLDGSTPAQARHQAMEHFNAPDSGDFAFLLSTRAGGLGINLATADTVIIFDSDWNPQNDLQAMSRAHRIGQSQTVNIYRLLTSGSVEEDILERAKQKMVLDHLVIQRMDTSGRTVLGAGAATAAAKQMFGKDEMAAILRFGAEQLFKEDDKTVEDKSKALYEDSIDAILARAEVVDEGMGKNEGADELLSAFNVATFKSAEDDKAFWNRLIPAGERADEKDRPEELGIRAARLKAAGLDAPTPPRSAAEDSGDDSDSGRKGDKGGKRKRGRDRDNRKRSHMASPVPGPQVAGALERLDEWPPACDAEGNTLRDLVPEKRVIGRRDAGVFIRAVRHYGLQSKLPEICGEVGRQVEKAPQGARLGLWFGLLRGCDRVLALAAELRKDAKDAVLDFYGVPVKAQEMRNHVDRIRLLADKIEELHDPVEEFVLPSNALPVVPKWGRACGWTDRDDAMLLLGVYRHGIDHWDKIAVDEELGLSYKLSAAGDKSSSGGLKADADGSMLPRGSHLETRVLGVLKKLQQVEGGATAAHGGVPSRSRARAPRSTTASGGSRRRGGGGRTRNSAPALDFDADGGAANGKDFPEPPNAARAITAKNQQALAEVWDEVRALKALQKEAVLPEDQVLAKTKAYLLVIGDHISHWVDQNGGTEVEKWEARLWQYVSKYTDNGMSGTKLLSVYSKIKRKKLAEAEEEEAEEEADAEADAEVGAAAGLSLSHGGSDSGADGGSQWGQQQQSERGQEAEEAAAAGQERDSAAAQEQAPAAQAPAAQLPATTPQQAAVLAWPPQFPGSLTGAPQMPPQMPQWGQPGGGWPSAPAGAGLQLGFSGAFGGSSSVTSGYADGGAVTSGYQLPKPEAGASAAAGGGFQHKPEAASVGDGGFQQPPKAEGGGAGFQPPTPEGDFAASLQQPKDDDAGEEAAAPAAAEAAAGVEVKPEAAAAGNGGAVSPEAEADTSPRDTGAAADTAGDAGTGGDVPAV